MRNVLTPATEKTSAAPMGTCPACEKPLLDPHGLGWCKACGYCRSLESGKTLVEAESVPEDTEAAPKVSAGEVLGYVPGWMWVILLNVVALAVGSFLVSRYLQLTPFQRALWTTIQGAVGISFMLLGQFIAVFRIAPEDSLLSFKDVFLPARLYGLILRRLPSTRIPFSLIIWGLALKISAFALIGGLGHWGTYLPGQKPPPRTSLIHPIENT